MRDEPSPSLVELLVRLRLATPGQIASVAPYARRLTGDLPVFESVWIDALAQARILTPYQAAQINAGRGDDLELGPYVIERAWPSLGYADCFTARALESSNRVRLLVTRRPHRPQAEALAELRRFIDKSRQIASRRLPLIDSAGEDREQLWTAAPEVEGCTAANWMVENGRFPPQVVLHIAREMCAALVELEQFDLVHGDLSARSLILTPRGGIVLAHAGIRGAVRPAEGYSLNDLSPEAYDYLAPERIAEGTPPSTASEVYACGALWWHLLAGRPPFAGGNSLAKLRAVQSGRVVEVANLAPDTPAPLRRAIAAAMQLEPGARPASMKELAVMLGPGGRLQDSTLARLLINRQPMRLGMTSAMRSKKRGNKARTLLVGAGVLGIACIALVLASASSRVRLALRPTRPAAVSQVAPAPAESKPPTPKVDRVQRASWQSKVDDLAKPNSRAVKPDDVAPQLLRPAAPLVLPTGRLLELESLELQPGQVVRGAKGQRPLVRVPHRGILVVSEGVRFESIDFVWNEAGDERAGARAAMIAISARRGEFHGCSFQSAGDSKSRPAAIDWITGPLTNRESTAVPAARLIIKDCVFRNVSAGIGCRVQSGTPQIELVNTLHARSGPLVKIGWNLRATDSLEVRLTHCTLRESAAVVEYLYQRVENMPGKVAITAGESAFIPDRQGGLVVLAGEQDPGRLLEQLEWSGQGSLVSQDAALVLWRSPTGRVVTVDEDAIEMGGLVRSEVTFAGDVAQWAAASQLTRWNAPLQSADPPGIGDGLVSPVVRDETP